MRSVQAPGGLLAFALAASAVAGGCLGGEVFEDEVLPPTAFLLPDPYPDLVVEVDYVEGYRPRDESLRVLGETLREVVDKRSVQVLDPTPMAPLPPIITRSDLWSAHASALDHRDPGDAAVIHVMFVNGRREDSPTALGVSISEAPVGLAFVFGENVRSVHNGTAPNPWYEKVERQTLVHEVGHVLGLVNNGVPMVHAREDPERPGHSRYEESVMFWGGKTHLSAAELLRDNGFLPYKFDEHDMEDLRALREGRTKPVGVA